eukprot:4256440-Prymnesium_polylepis.1
MERVGCAWDVWVPTLHLLVWVWALGPSHAAEEVKYARYNTEVKVLWPMAMHAESLSLKPRGLADVGWNAGGAKGAERR